MSEDPDVAPPPELPAIETAGVPERPKRTRRGHWLRSLLIALLVAVGVLAIRPWDYWDALTNGRRLPRQSEIVMHSPASNQAIDPINESRTKTSPKPPPRSFPPALAKVREGIALIEADGAGGREALGSGFVISADGQLVTCLHVISRTTNAVVRFYDGRVFDVAGYVAVDPQADLALLQVKESASLTPVQVAVVEPEQLTQVIAWGHPRGIEFSPFDGRVSRLVKSSELPAGLQRFVRELTAGDIERTWIQHTARLTEGNSGGPLANARGEVIGINMWVDRQSDYSYALPIAAVQTLQKNAFPEVEPLERFALAEARVRDATWQTSAQRLRELADEAQATKWQVHEWSDYARLQHIAWAVTLANAPEHFTARTALGDRLNDLVKEADLVTAQLHAVRWTDGGQIIVVNEFAEKEVTRPGAGVVFFGTVQRVVEGKNQERALLVQLAGFEQMLLVPLTGQLTGPEAGAQCLFVGVNDRGRTVRYGDNPLQPIVAPVIIAPVVASLK